MLIMIRERRLSGWRTQTMAMIASDALLDLLVRALTSAGYSHENARALARQTVLSEELGQKSVGVSHAFDYIAGIAGGRIDGTARPTISSPLPTMIVVDGNGGLPQTGFDLAFDDLVAKARDLGLAAFLQRDTTLCGSLGTFALRVAEAGLLCLAATNGSPAPFMIGQASGCRRAPCRVDEHR